METVTVLVITMGCNCCVSCLGCIQLAVVRYRSQPTVSTLGRAYGAALLVMLFDVCIVLTLLCCW
jgi:hypothetical protein